LQQGEYLNVIIASYMHSNVKHDVILQTVCAYYSQRT